MMVTRFYSPGQGKFIGCIRTYTVLARVCAMYRGVGREWFGGFEVSGALAWLFRSRHGVDRGGRVERRGIDRCG